MTEMSLNAKTTLSYLPVMLLRRLIYFKHVVAGAVGIMMHSGQNNNGKIFSVGSHRKSI